jgi:hypothetical protein
MNHNYYLYYNTDTNLYEWISWDLNMILNNFPVTGMSDKDAMDFLIDEPVLGSLSDYPLVQAVFLNDEYVERYHKYIEELIYGYLNEDAFQEKVLETYTMIETYAQNDPNAFFDFDTTTESIFGESNYSVLHFMSERIEHIEDQLDGTVASTNGGNGNEGTSKGMMGIGGDLNNAGGMRPGIGGDLDNTGEARLDMGGDMMNPGNINDQVMSTEDILAMLPVEVVQLYESGDLPDDIMDAINTGTPPPMDSMQALLDDLGLEMSLPNDTMNNGPSGNRQRPDQNAGTNENMTPPDQNNMMPGENLEQGNMDVSLNPVASNFDLSHVILLTLSLVVSISFSLYLTFKKV